ncbi:MAG: OmpA family protein [Hyphomicrobium sp.]|nr:OmpA family protein [Hyphomicrobium sp.]
MPRSSKYDQLRSKPPVALALVATFASAAALTVLYNHARNPKLSFAEIEQQASQDLAHIGYGWARVSIENGIATIEGEAPGESERVIAYDMVRRSLRPYTGKAHIIEGVSSHLQLSQAAAAALAQANTGRDAHGSDYYLSADSNLPYPAPRAVSGNKGPSGEMATSAALEPDSGQDVAVLEADSGTADPAAPESPQDATSVSKDEASAWTTSAHIDTQARRSSVAIEASDEPGASAVATDQPGSVTQDAASAGGLSSPSHSSSHQVAMASSLVEASATSVSDIPASPASSAGVSPAPTHAVTTAEAEPASPPPARIETAAVNSSEPTTRDAPAAVSAAAKTSLDATTDCKAEFADALSQSAIEFGSNSAVIEKKSRPLLDTLAQIAKRCSRFRLVVEGHTDLSGGKTHNQTLSQKRADAVRWALIDRGVDMDHITAQGYGSSRPLEQGTTETANARNRRIEFSVLEPQPRGRNAASAH